MEVNGWFYIDCPADEPRDAELLSYSVSGFSWDSLYFRRSADEENTGRLISGVFEHFFSLGLFEATHCGPKPSSQFWSPSWETAAGNTHAASFTEIHMTVSYNTSLSLSCSVCMSLAHTLCVRIRLFMLWCFCCMLWCILCVIAIFSYFIVKHIGQLWL